MQGMESVHFIQVACKSREIICACLYYDVCQILDNPPWDGTGDYKFMPINTIIDFRLLLLLY